MANQNIVLPSGATVTVDDIKTIKREAQKDTLKNALAGVGVAAVVGLALGYLTFSRVRGTD